MNSIIFEVLTSYEKFPRTITGPQVVRAQAVSTSLETKVANGVAASVVSAPAKFDYAGDISKVGCSG